MNHKLSIAVLAVVLFSVTFSSAEMRLWKDKAGKSIEAEYVRTVDDKVVLEQPDGAEIRVSLDTLSEKDRKYVVLKAPPRVEISVSIKTDRDNKAVGPSNRGSGMQVQREAVQASVEVRKSSAAPYESPLTSTVYLIGQAEQVKAYGILDKTKSEFRLTTENKNQHGYQSGLVSLKQLEAGEQAGMEYAGYIAVVQDRTGEVIAMKCSKLIFEKNAEAILNSAKGAAFDSDFNKMDRREAKAAAKEEKNSPPKKRFPGRNF